MTVNEIILLLIGYMEEKVPLSLPSLLNTLVINDVSYQYNSSSIVSGEYYTGYTASIVIEDKSDRYCIVIMNDKVVSIEHRKAPSNDLYISFSSR